MLSLLIRKELLEQLLSLRFAMACTICVLITVSSAIVLTRDYQEALADYRTNVVMHKNQLTNGYDIWGQGIVIDKPLNPMQIFVQGIEPQLIQSMRVTHQHESQEESEYEGNPVSYLFPPIDLLFFIGVVMSLLAIAFSYDAVSGEKETGTLKLLMSYAAPRDTILLAKWIGGFIALSTPFLLASVGALVVVSIFPDVSLRSQDWLALLLLIIVGLIYLSAIYGLGMFVSCRTHLASTSITVLLMVWVLMILVVPNVAPYLAAETSPVRDFTELEREKTSSSEDVADQFRRDIDSYAEANPDIERWGDDGRWGAQWNLMEQRRALQQMDDEEQINDDFMNQLAVQVNVASNLSRLSPFASFAYAATQISDTGLGERERFRGSLPDFRRQLTIYVTQYFSDAWRDGRINDQHDFSSRPHYEYRSTPLRERLDSVLVDVMLLMAWSIVFFMGSYLSFMRYDVK